VDAINWQIPFIVLIEHDNRDFCGDFELKVTLDWGSTIMALGRNRKQYFCTNFTIPSRIAEDELPDHGDVMPFWQAEVTRLKANMSPMHSAAE
jgi:hypothetical protein